MVSARQRKEMKIEIWDNGVPRAALAAKMGRCGRRSGGAKEFELPGPFESRLCRDFEAFVILQR